MWKSVTALLLAAALPTLAWANDTMAQLGTGGLVFVRNENIEMLSEDLFISREEVRVTYSFRNNGEDDEQILVAFPMPDITGGPDFMVSVPSDDLENPFEFQTWFEGEPVEAELHQYAFAAGIEQGEYLRELDIPLAPYGEATINAVNALPEPTKEEMIRLGLTMPMDYDDGNGWKRDYFPAWTLKSTYSWEAEFPAGEIVEVVHSYRPSVGGTTGVTFLYEPTPEEDRRADYARKYCMEESFVAAVEKTITPREPWSAPFFENWISYIWSTGANWGGPIADFTLTVDKGDPKNLVSFCGENVEKISPTQFQMKAKDFFPPWNRELEILILDRQEQ